MNRDPSPPVLNMTGIFKRFGPTIALENVNFKLRKGEVHALLGENGAGKSTLVKILSGALKQDKGKMFINGQPFIPSGPMDSRMKGISMIYQDLNLAPHLTVEENIMLGKEIHKTGFLKQGKMRDKVVKALEILQHPGIRPDIIVGRLGIGAKQIVEIARALVDQAFILIMDEPTSSLSREDSERLFEIIGNLKSQGVSIIYISHFLEEVQHVADRFTVLRDGRQVDSGSMKDVELDDIIQMMVGKKMADMFPRVDHQVGEPVLWLEGFRGKSMKENVNFSLRCGEIFGVAGLIGAGRTEMLRSIFGLEAVIEGTLSMEGVKRKKSRPWTRIKQGMGLLSEDRQGEGLALSLSIKDNVTLSHFSPYSNKK
jgi:ribose transport system ATP-binding protein